MAPRSKKSQSFFSGLNLFHSSGNSKRHSEVSTEAPRPQTSDGRSPNETSHPFLAEPGIQRSASIEAPPSAYGLAVSNSRIEKPLPSSPGEARGKRLVNHKTSFIGKTILGHPEKPKPKSPAKSDISAPFDPKKAVNPTMNPFQDHEHAWEAMEAYQSNTSQTADLAKEEKQSLPRSTSTLSFKSFFKIGSNRMRDGDGKSKSQFGTPKGSHAASENSNARKGTSISQSSRDTSNSADSPTPRGPGIAQHCDTGTMRRRQLRHDLDAHKAIDQSPKLQNFFYGANLFESTRFSSTSNAISYGSPAPKRMARRSMAILSNRIENELDSDEEKATQDWAWRDTKRPHTSYTTRATSLHRHKSSPALTEQTYRFRDNNENEVATNKQPSGGAKPRLGASNERPYMVPSESYHPNGKYNEGISGLAQHPNVMECVEPPQWYKDSISRGLQLSTPARSKADDFPYHPTTRHADRRLSRYIQPSEMLRVFERDPPVPEIPMQFAHVRSRPPTHRKTPSNVSKRSVEDAELDSLDPKNSQKRNKHSSLDSRMSENKRDESLVDNGDEAESLTPKASSRAEVSKEMPGAKFKKVPGNVDNEKLERLRGTERALGIEPLDYATALEMLTLEENFDGEVFENTKNLQDRDTPRASDDATWYALEGSTATLRTERENDNRKAHENAGDFSYSRNLLGHIGQKRSVDLSITPSEAPEHNVRVIARPLLRRTMSTPTLVGYSKEPFGLNTDYNAVWPGGISQGGSEEGWSPLSVIPRATTPNPRTNSSSSFETYRGIVSAYEDNDSDIGQVSLLPTQTNNDEQGGSKEDGADISGQDRASEQNEQVEENGTSSAANDNETHDDEDYDGKDYDYEGAEVGTAT